MYNFFNLIQNKKWGGKYEKIISYFIIIIITCYRMWYAWRYG
jgi:hypothetical protein